MRHATLILMTVLMIAALGGGNVSPSLAQTENDCPPASVGLEISGASGRSICDDITIMGWSWTAPATGPVTFDTRGSGMTQELTIFTLEPVVTTVALAQMGEVRFTAQEGVKYYITASSTADGQPSTIVLNWGSSPASADDFNSSVTVSGAWGRREGSNIGAGIENGEPKHAGDSGGASVWWTWTAPATEPVVFGTWGSDFDTLLAIYTGNSLNDLTVTASNDDAEAGSVVFKQSELRITAQQGQTYHIVVDGYGGETGTIVLNWWPASNSVSVSSDLTLHLSELQDTSQGKVISVDYAGSAFDEEELQVWVGDTSVESVFVDDQIHLILPLTEVGETSLEVDFGDFSANLPLDVLAAPIIADSPSYISGVADDLKAELEAFSDGDWGDEIAALYAAEQELSDLSAGEIRELAVFLKQNIESLLRHLNSPVVAEDKSLSALNRTKTILPRTSPAGVSQLMTGMDLVEDTNVMDEHEADCESEMRSFLFSRQAVTALIGGAVLYAFAPEPSKAIGLPLTLAGVVTGVVLIMDATEDILDACLIPVIADIQAGLGAPLSFSAGSTAGSLGAMTAGIKVAQQASGTMSTIRFDEGQARAITLSLNHTFDPERRSEFVSAIQGLGDLLLKLNNGLRSVGSILPGLLTRGINSFIRKFDGFISTLAGLENPDRVATANHADFRLEEISDRNITGSITSANSDRLFLEFSFEDSSLVPQDGCVDFGFALSNSRDGLENVNVPGRLCASEPEASIAAIHGAATEGTEAVFTVTFTPSPMSDITLRYTVSQRGDFVSPTHLGNKTLRVAGGTTTVTITVPTEDDQNTEVNGVVQITIDADTGYSVFDTLNRAEVTVNDNDMQMESEARLRTGNRPVTEGTEAVFTVTFTPAPMSDITLRYTVSQQGDFVSPTHLGNKTLRVAGGTTTATITVLTEDDQDPEIDGRVIVTLDDGDGYNPVSFFSNSDVYSVIMIDDDRTNCWSPSAWGGSRFGKVLTDEYEVLVAAQAAARAACKAAFDAAEEAGAARNAAARASSAAHSAALDVDFHRRLLSDASRTAWAASEAASAASKAADEATLEAWKAAREARYAALAVDVTTLEEARKYQMKAEAEQKKAEAKRDKTKMYQLTAEAERDKAEAVAAQ